MALLASRAQFPSTPALKSPTPYNGQQENPGTLDGKRMMAYRCKLLWPRVHPYTQPTSSQPPTEKRGPSSQDKWVGRRRITGGKSKLGSPSSRKNRHRRQTTETEEIIIPAPGGRPSHPPTHNTSTTSPWSQYPSPLQSGISSPHLLISTCSYLESPHLYG